MPIRFRPPRDVPDLGLSRGQQERFNAWLRTAFTEIAEDMAALGQSDAPTIVAQETIDVAAGSMRRVTPPVGGMAVRVPAPTPANAGQTVRLMIEAPVGDLTVAAVPGIGDDGKVFQPTINGEPRATFTTSGLVTLTSNGSSDWKSASEFAAESPASVAISSGGAALDAQYLLRSANASLPNARVADDSTEIDISYSSPGLISWFLKTASVAFSKLANLTGLSVLGRATNSSGVMAAITSTAARQVLRNNDAGTSLEWQFPLEAQLDDADIGNIHTLNVEVGRFSVSSGIATLEKPQSVTDAPSGTQNSYALPATLRHGDILSWNLSGGAVTLNGINSTGVPDGFEFTLTQSNGGLPDGNQLTVVDESGSAGAAGYRIGTPDNISMIVGTAGSIRFRRLGDATTGRWFAVERGFPRASTSIAYGGTSGREMQLQAAVAGAGMTMTSQVLNVIGSTSITVNANDIQRPALTGFAAASANSNATTSAEPIVTYSASANMSAERVTTSSTSVTVSTSVAGQIEFQRAALTGAVSAAANANATLFAGIRDNGTLETARGFINALSTSTITALITQDAANDEQEWTWAVNLAATYAWTGGHSWNTAGDFDVTAALVSLLSSSTLSLDSVGDMTLQSDADLILTGDEVRVRSNGTGGFLTFDGATASTPGLAAGEGMYWVEDPGAAATIPRFTDDANVDWKLLAFGQPGDSALPSVGFTSTPFVVYRDVAASGSAVARDTALFNGNVPFALSVIQCGVRVNPGVGGSTMTFRDTVGGGGNALSSALSTATTGTVQISANYTGVVQVAAGGSITCRWSDGTTGGRVWALCVRD